MTDKTKGLTNAGLKASPQYPQAKAPVRALHSSFFLSKEDHSPSLTASSMTPTSAKSRCDSPPSSALGDRFSPQPQLKLRKLPLKSKYRNPLQGVGGEDRGREENDREEKEEQVQRPTWDSVMVLEQEVKRLKKDVRAKSVKITELQQTDDDRRRPHSRVSVDWNLLLDKKEQQIRPLRQQLESSRPSASADPEMKRLANLFVAAETNLAQVKAERDQLAAKIKEMEGRQTTSASLYEVLSRFQGENKMLMDEVRRLQGKLHAQASFKTLERQLSELQSTHQQLMADNARLHSEIETHKDAWRRQQEKLFETACSLREARRDISQLTEVVRIVRNGAGVSSALILGHMAQPSQFQPLDDTSEVALNTEATGVKTEICSLRQYLSDLYAEQSGNLCSTQ